MSRGLTNMHTACGLSDLYHVFARKQCILCPALHHGCLTLIYVTSIRDFFYPWNNRARLYYWLLPHSLASSRGYSLAINVTWQQHHNRFSSKSNFSLYQHFLRKCFSLQILWVLASAVQSFTKMYTMNFKISLNFYKKGIH